MKRDACSVPRLKPKPGREPGGFSSLFSGPPISLFLLIALFLLPASSPLFSSSFDEDVLVFELWVELEPAVENYRRPDAGEDLPSIGGSGTIGRRSYGPISEREAIERVLEEAQIVVSAMIYGYRVEYTPLDRARGVEEQFVLEAVARIERGDRRLQTMDSRRVEGRLYIRFRYDLSEDQILRRSLWGSNTIPSATATGTAPLREGYRGKFLSFEEAVKQGLRGYLRPREYNKPREIVGRVLFIEPPYTRINAGGYHSKLRMKLNLEEVLPYGAY